jgi:hypothetical protein
MNNALDTHAHRSSFHTHCTSLFRVAAWSLFGAALLVLAVGAGMASATTRYAAPGGTAAADVCVTPQADPCSIRTAAAGPGVTGADEAVLAPGEYTDVDIDADSNGVWEAIDLIASNVHGAAGEPRPRITLASNFGSGAFSIRVGKRLARVEIVTDAAQSNLTSRGGIVEDVIARSSRGGAIVCKHQPSGTVALIRDTACLSTGTGSTAVGANLGTFNATHTAALRNVTAVATGTNSRGADYRINGPADFDVDARALLAQGVAADVAATATDVDLDFVLAHSNYSTVTASAAQGGTADVTPAGAADNQTAEPALAADGIHQLPQSPTIEAGGAADMRSGTADLDGHQRTIGMATDIGADEFEHPTVTEIDCGQDPVTAGSGATECLVTVTDTSAAPLVPAGEVTVSSDSPGGVTPEACALVQTSASQASCAVSYAPTAVGSGTHAIEAYYPGFPDHAVSVGLTDVAVVAPPAAPRAADPTGVGAGAAKKCKRKPKGKRAKRKRCGAKKRKRR